MGLFNKRKDSETYVPVPDNLRTCTTLFESYNDNDSLILKTQCICGSKSFMINYFGDPTQYENQKSLVEKSVGEHSLVIVDCECIQCSRNYQLFDSRFQGNNGFFNLFNIQKAPKPNLENWNCEKCKQNNFSALIDI